MGPAARRGAKDVREAPATYPAGQDPAPEEPVLRLAALPPLLLCLAACGSPPMACGEPSPGGGPWRIVTRDQELCEVTRLQVEHELTSRLASLDPFVVDRWIDASWGWTEKTTDGVVAQVREDCGDEVADAVARAVADVRAHSVRTVAATCEDAERCLAKGAALGTRLAIENAAYYLKHEKPKPELKPNQGE